MKQASKLLAAALAAALSLVAYGQQPGAQPHRAAAKPVTLHGSIESIDREAETLSLKAAEDSRITVMRVDRSLANFDKLEKGDKVTARYAEAVLLSVVRSDGPVQPTAEAPPSTPGSDDAAVAPAPAVEPSRMMATVTNVDADAGKVTLQAPKGEEIRMRVHDRETLAGLKKGDEVVATYIEARALSVVPQDDPQGNR